MKSRDDHFRCLLDRGTWSDKYWMFRPKKADYMDERNNLVEWQPLDWSGKKYNSEEYDPSYWRAKQSRSDMEDDLQDFIEYNDVDAIPW